jgi:pyruvate dehydrogenase E2 component (dihydrolipoamide acetyltransferase)
MATEFKLPDLGENIEAGDIVQMLVKEGDVIEAGQNVLEIETEKAVVELPCPHAGRVVKVHVKAGDHVPVGALLLTIDTGAAAGAGSAAVSEAPPASSAPARVPPKPAEKPAAARPSKGAAPTLPASPPPPSSGPVAPSPPVVPGEAPPAVERATRVAPGAVVPASPAVRRLARELGVDLRHVEGTGPGERITEDDVKRYVRQLASTSGSGGTVTPGAPIAPPLPDFTKWGSVERRPLRGIRRKTAENVSLAWELVPHVTQFDLADVTELESARKRYVARKKALAKKAQTDQAEDADVPPVFVPPLTMTVLVMKAVAKLLQAYPQFNASLDAATGDLILKQYYHIGVAVDTEHGLIVPVVRDVDQKGILQLASELDELAARARQRKVDLEELRGGTFTISNLGGLGGTGFTPIVNYPEVAILGIARSRQEQVLIEGRPETRTMLPLCLSYDHRVVDGADGVRFLRSLAEILSDPFDLLLEG